MTRDTFKAKGTPPPAAPLQQGQVDALEVFRIAGGDTECEPNPTPERALEVLRDLRACYDEAIAQQPVGGDPIDANNNAEYIEHCADRLERCGLPVTAGALRAIAHEHRALSQQPAAARVDVRKLVALAEQWERDADVCRRDGYIDAAVVKEDCAYRIRQTLGISASESSFILLGCDPLVKKLLSIAIKDKEKERLTARAEQPEVRGGVDAPGSREWMAEVCRAAALSLAAHGVWNDQLLKVADWIAQQGGEVT